MTEQPALFYWSMNSCNGTNRVRIGSTGRIGNSQSELDAGASSVVDDGKNVVLKLALAFKAPFSGKRNAYIYGRRPREIHWLSPVRTWIAP